MLGIFRTWMRLSILRQVNTAFQIVLRFRITVLLFPHLLLNCSVTKIGKMRLSENHMKSTTR